MTEKMTCPICGEGAEGSGNATRVGIGPGSTASERTLCPGCGVVLVRNPDSATSPWIVDRADNGIAQCEARLRALADAKGWRYDPPLESSQGVWRVYLWERTDEQSPSKTSPIWGSGISAEDALQEAVYEAEVKGFI